MTTFITSNEFAEFSEKLSGCMGDGLCDENVHGEISRINFKKYEKVFNLLSGQSSVSLINPSYSMYKANLFTSQSSHHIDISANIKNMFYTTIQADDKFLFLNCLNLESLLLFLIENSNETTIYISIPVIFGSEVHTIGHFCILTFNIVTMEVFFIDPNGKSTYFDNIFHAISKKNNHIDDPWIKQYTYSDEMYINSEKLVENMIELYIADLNTAFGTKYKFVKRAQWNVKGYAINKNFDASLIKSGHCVCIGTLIANYLHITKESPSNIFDKLSKMETSEIIELINSYSCGIYELLQNTR